MQLPEVKGVKEDFPEERRYNVSRKKKREDGHSI